MNDWQRYALHHPFARADGRLTHGHMRREGRLTIGLSVNK